MIKYKDILELTRRATPSGSERIPVSNTEYITSDDIARRRDYYHIHTSKDSAGAGNFTLNTIIEGVDTDDLTRLSDSSKYRLCLMRHRKKLRGGRGWRITALPYFAATRTGIPVEAHRFTEEHTWWGVTGRAVPWFRGASIMDVLPYGIDPNNKRFKNSKNLKMLDGVALFEYTGRGGEGWSRISNIAYVESFLCRRNSIDKPAYVSISVKV